ncbi:MAG: hypothetical protein HPY66_0442 [Firmicutes bacterium]|nr:hypothetical protein [Bacillota bacterium]MDI6705138.1 hypothetical protein [Bacillota bacterium]
MDAVLKYAGLFWSEVKSLYTLYLFLLTAGTGIFEFFFDGQRLRKEESKKEEILARLIGALYFLGGIGLFILVKLA